MQPDPLLTLDLNLLKVFKAVMELRQTTAAASRLGLTQPAVSQALKRLRDSAGDPLFIAGRNGMEPTQRALDMAGPVNAALAQIAGAFQHAPDFDPRLSKRRFTLGMLDYGVMVFAPQLAGFLSEHAPGVRLDILHMASNAAPEMLEGGSADLATGPFANLPQRFQKTFLFADRFVAIARRKHPALQGGLTKEVFAGLAHLDVGYASEGAGALDHALRANAMERRVAMRVPHFTGAVYAVAASDMISVIPRRVAEAHRQVCDIDLFDIPFAMPPLEIYAAVHQRNTSDAGLRWLVKALAERAHERWPAAPPTA